jgi:hypothetical protein
VPFPRDYEELLDQVSNLSIFKKKKCMYVCADA